MGLDYDSLQVFGGSLGPAATREGILAALGYAPGRQTGAGPMDLAQPPDASLAVAVGPPQRWITVLDSCFGLEDDWLPCTLSALAPVVTIWVYDSSAVHYHLYREGRLVDQYGNCPGVVRAWDSEEERERFSGHPALWADLLLDPQQLPRLRALWREFADAGPVQTQTAALFGWHPLLSRVGYTVHVDGIPGRYQTYINLQQRPDAGPATGAAPRRTFPSGRARQAVPPPDERVDPGSFTEFVPAQRRARHDAASEEGPRTA